jgi:hypothetical protein
MASSRDFEGQGCLYSNLTFSYLVCSSIIKSEERSGAFLVPKKIGEMYIHEGICDP